MYTKKEVMMLMGIKRSLLGGLFSVVASGALAAGSFFECDMDVKHPNGWVSAKIGLIFAEDGQVSVIDGPILHIFGAPIPAKARLRGDKIRLNWSLPSVEIRKHRPLVTFKYLGNFDQSTNALSVVAKPVGYPQRFSGKGTCTPRKSKKGFNKALRR